MGHHLPRQAAGLRRCHATTALADIDLDEDRGAAPLCVQRRGEPLDAEDRIDRHRQLHAPGQCREPRQLGRGDDFVADEDVGHAAFGQSLGLADLLNAHPDGAGLHLQPCDRRALVGFGMRPEPQPVNPHKGGHRLEVALHRVQIDDQRRCVDRRCRVADAGPVRRHARCSPSVEPEISPSTSLAPRMSPASRCCMSLQPISVKPCGV